MEPRNCRKSSRSYSSGGCVEVGELPDAPADCRKSSYSMSNGNCPKAGTIPGGVAVLDTKQDDMPGRPVLAFTGEAWRAFAERVKRDEAVAA